MRGLWVALAIVILFASAPARAEDDIEMEPDPPAEPAAPGTKDPKVSKKWLQTAQTLVQKGDAATRAKKDADAKVAYENAITAYERAIEAGDDINIYFDLAALEEKAGKLDQAATHYRVIVKGQGARADLVKKATARWDDLTSKTGLVMLFVKPDGTTITIGGKEHGKTPLAESLVLMPGTYSISLAAEGHQPKDIEFKVEPGSESERTLELEPGKIKVQPVKRKVETPEEPVITGTQGPNKLPLYVGLGATGGFVLLATITGIVAVGKHGTFEDENASPGDREDAKDSGKTFAIVTDVMLVGALAAGGFTAYWYFAKYKPAQRKMAAEQSARRTTPPSQITAKAALAPWVQSDAGGLVLAGSF